jgi:hypothetical protein
VERWFGYPTVQRSYRGVRKSVQTLKADICDWIEHWKPEFPPFRWAKTADEILDSPPKCLARISWVRHISLSSHCAGWSRPASSGPSRDLVASLPEPRRLATRVRKSGLQCEDSRRRDPRR